MKLKKTIKNIRPLNKRKMESLKAYHQTLLMPKDAMASLLDQVEKLAGIYGEVPVRIPKRRIAVIFAGDHGVVKERVSVYPQEVTKQMLTSFANGWAVITVVSKQQKMDVEVVDVGVIGDVCQDTRIINQKIAAGTKNFTQERAMNRNQAEQAIEIGIAVAAKIAKNGYDIAVVGEMGIGNTTSSSAITSAVLGVRPEEVTGRGTGIDDNGLKRKIAAIKKGLTLHKPDPKDPLDVLCKVGGFEIGAICGFILGCAEKRIPVVLDGFITGSAALLAYKLLPRSIDYCFAGHCSQERGHKQILLHLGLFPLLNLNLRLGEGSGAALALSLLENAIYISRETATFATAKVSNKE